MSPILKPYDIKTGFWGQPTATLDWCERNYEVKFSKKLLLWANSIRFYWNYGLKSWFFFVCVSNSQCRASSK